MCESSYACYYQRNTSSIEADKTYNQQKKTTNLSSVNNRGAIFCKHELRLVRRCMNTQGSSQILPRTRTEPPTVRTFDHTAVARSPQLQPVEGFGLQDERGSRSCVGVQDYPADCSSTIQSIVRPSTRFGVDLATRSAGPFDAGIKKHIWGETIKYRTVVVDYHSAIYGGHSISNPHRTTKENNFL